MRQDETWYQASVDTVGSLAIVQLDGKPAAAVLCAPREPSFLPGLHETYTRLWRANLAPLAPAPFPAWDGSKIRIVASRRTGDLWDVCVGFEATINRYLRTENGTMHQLGAGELWNYWTVRLAADYIPRWSGLAKQNRMIYFTLLTALPGGSGIREFDTIIPHENLLLRP